MIHKLILDKTCGKKDTDFANAEEIAERVQKSLKNKNGEIGKCIMDTIENGEKYFKSPIHPFLFAVHAAYADECPLEIYPEHIQVLILHGVATWVNNKGQKYQKFFSDSLEKKELKIEVKNISEFKRKDWENLIEDFCGKMILHEDIKELFHCPKDVVSGHLSLMNAAKEFYKYVAYTKCGISEIHVHGDIDEWMILKKKIQILTELDLGFWLKGLTLVIDNIIEVVEGKGDTAFWNSFYKYNGKQGSGTVARIDGHVNNLFLYCGKYLNSYFKDNTTKNAFHNFEFELKDCDVTWFHVYDPNNPKHFKLASGFSRIMQNPKTLAYYPKLDWFIFEYKPVPPKEIDICVGGKLAEKMMINIMDSHYLFTKELEKKYPILVIDSESRDTSTIKNNLNGNTYNIQLKVHDLKIDFMMKSKLHKSYTFSTYFQDPKFFYLSGFNDMFKGFKYLDKNQNEIDPNTSIFEIFYSGKVLTRIPTEEEHKNNKYTKYVMNIELSQ